MADIKGFRGLRYTGARISSLDEAITPPFDVIDKETRGILAQQSPYNMVHLILPQAQGQESPYDAAAKHLEEWIAAGVLAKDTKEHYYLLEQTFKGLDGRSHTRQAFFAAVKAPEPGEDNVVLGHERTFDTKVTDRLALTGATQANLGAVFCLYEDPERVLDSFLGHMGSCPPDFQAHTVDGTLQRVWLMPADPAISEFFEGKTLYIADGHHRFRTAVLHRDRMREQTGHDSSNLQPWDYLLMGLVRMDDPGLVVWPTHRLLDPPEGFDCSAFLKKLNAWFDVSAMPGANDDTLLRAVDEGEGTVFGFEMAGEGRYILRLRELERTALLGEERHPLWRQLDVAVLHRGIFEGVLGLKEGTELAYEPNYRKALARVAAGEKRMAFLLKAIPAQQVKACAEARVFMPEKATYFFPKLPSGAVMHRFV